MSLNLNRKWLGMDYIYFMSLCVRWLEPRYIAQGKKNKIRDPTEPTQFRENTCAQERFRGRSKALWYVHTCVTSRHGFQISNIPHELMNQYKFRLTKIFATLALTVIIFCVVINSDNEVNWIKINYIKFLYCECESVYRTYNILH